MDTLPMDVLVMMGCFMWIDVLARVRQTCKTLQAALIDAQHDALFVPSGKWYELKDVALAAKYMTWTGRVPSSAPTLDTMDNIAFWGTLVDGDRLLATIGPNVVTFKTNLGMIGDNFDAGKDFRRLVWETDTIEYTWADTKTEQEYTTQLDGNRYQIMGMPHCFFLKQCQIKMYAAVNLSSGVGVYELISGAVESDNVKAHDGRAYVDPTELMFEGESSSFLQVWADGVELKISDKTADFPFEWCDEYCDACDTKCIEMETAVVQSATNAGRGWNSTRRDVLEKFMAQLH